MKKELKIILYCVLGVILIVVLCLMIGGRKHDAGEPDVIPTVTPELIGQEINENNNEVSDEIINNSNSEQDILNDLEALFNNNNGYENVKGDFGFISSDN